MSDFVHLHLHTQYSVLDGAIKLKDLIAKVKEQKHQAVAVTDHGNMHGTIEFYQLAKAQGIKPIFGCEVYTTPGSRFDKTPQGRGGAGNYHLTLLAQNMEGYRNLCRLVTLAYTEGFYFRPRVDLELLRQYNKGLICLSGCVSAELADYSKAENIQGARQLIDKYLSVFGSRYYLEVQPHQMREQQQHNKMLGELAKELGVPLVATNDCHYLGPDDHYAQEVLMCVSTGKLISDEERLHHEQARLHFKSGQEMRSELPEFEDAVRRSVEIAEQCNVDFDFSTYFMPNFTVAPEYCRNASVRV